MNNLSKALLGLAMVTAALPAFADNLDTRPYYLDLDYDHVFADKDRDTKDGNGFNVGLGKRINQYWNVEIDGFYNYLKAKDAGKDFHEYGSKLDGMFFYSRKTQFSPYFGLGVGGMQSELKGTSKSFDPYIDAGLGFFSFWNVNSQPIGLRADARYRFVDANNVQQTHGSRFGEPVLRVGLVLPFGLPEHHREQVAAPMCCAAPAPAPAPALAPVIQPAPAKVVEQPTPAPEAPIRTYANVFFNFNKADLTPRSKTELNKVASEVNDLVKKNSGLRVTVAAHTDSKGSAEYNKKLSERRADTVKNYLVQKGVDASRISTAALGDSQPDGDNKTAAGRARNRHADVNVYAH